MFCTRCGSEIKEGNKFCTSCGSPTDGSAGVGSNPVDAPIANEDATDEMATAVMPAASLAGAQPDQGSAAPTEAMPSVVPVVGSGVVDDGAAKGKPPVLIIAIIAAVVVIAAVIGPFLLLTSEEAQESAMPPSSSSASSAQEAAEESSSSSSSSSSNASSSSSSSSSSVSGYMDPDEEAGYVLPYSNTRLYTEEELSSLSDWDLYVARNEIFARHGRGFKNSDLAAHFSAKPWYKNMYSPEEFDAMPSPLNDIEKANSNLILSIERARGSAYAV